MARHHTFDHEEIRNWIMKHGGHPAVINDTTHGESDGVLTLVFGDDPDARNISWREFFIMFESAGLEFRYEEPIEPGEPASWSYAFEDRDKPNAAPDDETELPEDVDNAEENMFPSS